MCIGAVQRSVILNDTVEISKLNFEVSVFCIMRILSNLAQVFL